MKRILTISLATVLIACNTLTIGVVVASIGIAGAAYEAYCTSAACSPQEMALGVAVVAESVREERTLLSGQTTPVVVAQTVSNLTGFLVQARVLPQTPTLVGIESAIQVAIPLIQALATQATNVQLTKAQGEQAVGHDYPLVIPIHLTAKDRAALVKMDVKIAAVRH